MLELTDLLHIISTVLRLQQALQARVTSLLKVFNVCNFFHYTLIACKMLISFSGATAKYLIVSHKTIDNLEIHPFLPDMIVKRSILYRVFFLTKSEIRSQVICCKLIIVYPKIKGTLFLLAISETSVGLSHLCIYVCLIF